LGIPFTQITPEDVKLAGTGNPNASKKDMVDWAVATYPQVEWPTQTKRGITSIVARKAEHLADALGAIRAGIAQPEFQRPLNFVKEPV